MNLSNFKNDVYVNVANRPHYIRYGQAVYNYVYQKYPEVREKLSDLPDGTDPFYDDERVEVFLDKCFIYLINEKITKITCNT